MTVPPTPSASLHDHAQFLALQKRLATHESTIQSLHKRLDAKEAQQDKLKHEAMCGSTVQKDVDTLMVRAASLERALVQVRQREAKGRRRLRLGQPYQARCRLVEWLFGSLVGRAGLA